jgi:Plasmid pRiA4b ORF-3-like protein
MIAGREGRAMAKSKAPGVVYQLKVTLKDVRPPIWRRVQVKDCTLAKLHDVIQDVMGWEDCHLHAFRIGDEEYGPPDPHGMLEVEDEARMKLSQVVGQGHKKFTYNYDFGDNWDHEILIEKTLEAEAGVKYPRCVAGKRACPPEDCGGPWGYGSFLQAISDPANKRHEELLEWIGGEFDPEAFDVEAVNERLR